VPNDLDEYTDCRSAIRAAMAGGSGNKTVIPPGGVLTPSGAVASTPADYNELNRLASDAGKGKRTSVDIGGRSLLPGSAGLGGILSGVAGRSEMPLALALAVASLAILAVVTGYLGVSDKLPGLRRAALRILGR
jgi:hypothetical protein